LTVVAQQFSPRYETRGDLVVIDVCGLERLFGDARAIGEELRREAADRGMRVHVAIAATQTAAASTLSFSREFTPWCDDTTTLMSKGRRQRCPRMPPAGSCARSRISAPR